MKQVTIKTLSIFMIALLLGQLAGCANSPRNPFRGRAKVTVGPLPEVAQSIDSTVIWKERATKGAGDFNKIRPQITQNVIYQADHKGVIVAYEKSSGQKLWQKETNLPISSGPVNLANKIFVGTKDARVVAFNKANGDVEWQAKVTSEVLSPPMGNDSILLVNSIDGHLTAFDINNGRELWTYERVTPSLTLRGGSSPVLADDKVLAGFANGKLVALDLKTGSLAWERTISVPRGRSELHRMVDIITTPVVSNNEAFVATYQGNVVAINIVNGQVKWQRQISSHRDMQLDENALYITDNDFKVWALDRKNGSTLWKQAALEKRLITGPSMGDDYLVVGDYGGYVHWLRKNDGEIISMRSLGKKILQTPVSDGKTTFVTSNSGEMTALVLEEGA
jgi:outer membrane protein assembly factor BamB